MAKGLPRGIRNNNPGNLEAGADQWQGLDEPRSDGRFCRFVSPAYGVRALARTLIVYQDKREAKDGSEIDTVREVIERWAPANENDTQAYIESVWATGQFKPGQHLDMHDFDQLSRLVKAIILHECGVQPYSKAQITKGLVLAGVEPEKPPAPAGTRAGLIGGGATGLGLLANYAEGAKETAINVVTTNPSIIDRLIDLAPWILGGVALLAIGWFIWSRMKDRSQPPFWFSGWHEHPPRALRLKRRPQGRDLRRHRLGGAADGLRHLPGRRQGGGERGQRPDHRPHREGAQDKRKDRK